MYDLSLQQILLRLVAIIVISAVHGFLIAAIARAMGDKGPSHDGRLTPNPFAHVDMLAVVAALIGRWGWIRPIALDPERLRGGRAGPLIVVVLALLAVGVIAVVAWSLRALVITTVPDATFATGLVVGMRVAVEMTAYYLVINIVPIPPLSAGLIWQGLAPALYARLFKLDLPIRLAIVVLAGLAWLTPVLEPLVGAVSNLLGVR